MVCISFYKFYKSLTAVFVLDKTCSYQWCSLRHIFPCLNGPNMVDKLNYTLVASGQQLVLAVVNSSDWDTDDHRQSRNGLDKETRKMKKLYNSAWGLIHDSLCGVQKDMSAELTQEEDCSNDQGTLFHN